MHPFSALRSDKQDSTPSDDLGIAPPPSSPHGESPPSSSSSFTLRIKLNSSDYVLRVSGSSTVGTLKRWILQRHSADAAGDPYLRLIVRGRMMAPDSAALDAFSVSSSDVVHAVLAKEEGRGAQARMLRRINRVSEGSARNAGVEERGDGDSIRRLWRRIGIDARGVVLERSGEEESEDSSEEDEETDREDDNRERDGRGRRTRERRGFDRLRSTGMSREEVNTLRLYFARSVDRYIERRRILIRASNQWRNRSNATRDSEPDSDVNETRDRSDTGEDSTNSLLEVEAGDDDTGDSHGMSSHGRQPLVTVDLERGDHRDETPSTASEPATTAMEEEGEDILLDRRRMEDEWMSTQRNYSAVLRKCYMILVWLSRSQRNLSLKQSQLRLSSLHGPAALGGDRQGLCLGIPAGVLCGIHHVVLGLDAHGAAQAENWNYLWNFVSVGVEFVEEERGGGSVDLRMFCNWVGSVCGVA
ncbi:hypothetical protein ACHAWX_003785 [Stephanocyclus meneghinianus]